MDTQATYAELKQQIAELEKQAEAVRRAELAAVIADVKQKIADFGLTAADLGFAGAAGGAKHKAPKAAGVSLAAGEYRNPVTGETYAYRGRGRKPAWIAAMSEEEIGRCRVG
jgi:DNA-binding protein H-NS